MMSEDEIWTFRLLLMQFFRPSGNVGEHADRELCDLYACDDVGEQPIEAEIVSIRDMVIGPIKEDRTPSTCRMDEEVSYTVTLLPDPPIGNSSTGLYVECAE